MVVTTDTHQLGAEVNYAAPCYLIGMGLTRQRLRCLVGEQQSEHHNAQDCDWFSAVDGSTLTASAH
jgi:hypothetical protein